MHAVLAFSNLSAAAPRQRARCVRTGRFVAWSRAAALRSPAAPAVVVLTPTPVVVVEAPTPVVVVEAPPVSVVGTSSIRVIARVASTVARVASRVGGWVASLARRVVAAITPPWVVGIRKNARAPRPGGGPCDAHRQRSTGPPSHPQSPPGDWEEGPPSALTAAGWGCWGWPGARGRRETQRQAAARRIAATPPPVLRNIDICDEYRCCAIP